MIDTNHGEEIATGAGTFDFQGAAPKIEWINWILLSILQLVIKITVTSYLSLTMFNIKTKFS